MKIKIEYELDGTTMEEAGLNGLMWIDDKMDEDEIADYISKETGWLVKSWEKIDKPKFDPKGIYNLRMLELCPVCGGGELNDENGDANGICSTTFMLKCNECGTEMRVFSAPVQVEILGDDFGTFEEQYFDTETANIITE